ncbi:MAG: PAS domain S-box protein [Gammaproteobacteria bacterium]|nr:PAS domain S-box protein [Gammaproteobacteria bacterium]
MTEKFTSRIESVLESVDASIVTIDSGGLITDCNSATSRLFGYLREELLGRNVKMLMPSPYRDQHDGYLTHHLNTGENRIIGIGRNVSGLRKNGEEFPLHLSVAKFEDEGTTFFTGIIHDISELYSAQFSINRLGRIIEELDSEVYTFSVDSLQITSANPAAVKNMGYSLKELLGKKPMDLVHGLTEDILRQTLEPLVETRDAEVELQQRFIRQDGSRYHADVNLYLSAAFDPPEFVVIAKDVTERNQMMNSLRQSQKMESIGNLTGGIAHDFNNLLTVILGNLEMLEFDSDNSEQSEMVKEAREAAEMGARLTQRLLSFARRSPLSPTRLDINVKIRDLIELLSRTLGTEVVLRTALADTLYDVNIDESELENALINLCINARDAMPKGGTLLITTSNATLDADSIVDKQIEPGNYVRLEVTDTGCGIATGLIESIFEPFVSTKSSADGTGLGLSMVYGFVKQSGGEISVYSELNLGTTFTIYLPAYLVNEERKSLTGTLEEGHSLESKRVLVAEDNIRVRKLTIKRLEALGHIALDAEDGQQALKLFLSNPQNIDCVFTDVVMKQGMTGYDLAQEIQRIDPNMPILLTSGYAENVVNAEKLVQSGLPLLRKPFSQQDLKEAFQLLFTQNQRH